MPERISLITTILSNKGEVGIVRGLCGDDAQAFIDAIYEARFHSISSSPENGSADLG